MMKTLYLDIFSGISGDMFIAAMIDLGVSEHQIRYKVADLGVGGYRINVSRKEKSGIAGVKFDVNLEAEPAQEYAHAHAHAHPHPHERPKGSSSRILNASFTKFVPAHAIPPEPPEHTHAVERNYSSICELISRSRLSDWVKERSMSVFRRIAVAEGKIHGKPPEQVHFHEVGAVDSIVDVVGACVALELLGKPRVFAANVQEGTGWMKCAHGRFPIPAPAMLGILSERGVPVTQCEEAHELVTPTGAALLAEFVESFGPMQGLVPEKIGFGLGTRNLRSRPNVLRAVLGEMKAVSTGAPPAAPAAPAAAPIPQSTLDWEIDTVAVLETNLDDINAELLGAFVEKALAVGALDVFHTPIQMKKNRPAVLLTVLCAEAEADKFCELLLRETTAFGVRRTLAQRRKLRRELVNVATVFGDITVKLGKLEGKVVQSAPEFESCRAAAEKAGVPLKIVYDAARAALSAPPWQP
jgi:uncharacterized protein (TIGR00299 family) protein